MHKSKSKLPSPQPVNAASQALFARAREDYEQAVQRIANQALDIDKPAVGWALDLSTMQWVPPQGTA